MAYVSSFVHYSAENGLCLRFSALLSRKQPVSGIVHYSAENGNNFAQILSLHKYLHKYLKNEACHQNPIWFFPASHNFFPLNSCWLKLFCGLYCKQYGPRSVCYLASSLIRAHYICISLYCQHYGPRSDYCQWFIVFPSMKKKSRLKCTLSFMQQTYADNIFQKYRLNELTATCMTLDELTSYKQHFSSWNQLVLLWLPQH